MVTKKCYLTIFIKEVIKNQTVYLTEHTARPRSFILSHPIFTCVFFRNLVIALNVDAAYDADDMTHAVLVHFKPYNTQSVFS